MIKRISLLIGLVFIAITVYLAAEIYDAGSFRESCSDFVGLTVDKVTWKIIWAELMWNHSKIDGVISVYQNNVLLADRGCSLHHSNGVVVNATWK